jgi:hypothetical protein
MWATRPGLAEGGPLSRLEVPTSKDVWPYDPVGGK